MKDSGFTIIELIVVVAIFGLLLAIASISGKGWLDRYRVEGQTKQMYTDLMNARVSALQRNRMFFVTLTPNQYAIYEDMFPPPDGNGNLDLGAGQDRLVTQTTTQYTLNFSETFNFTQNGLVSWSSGTNSGTIWFTSTANPGSDCIALSTTRILMGKMNGTNCIVQ